MSRRDRTIFCAFVLALAACGSNKKEVESAKHSLYDTDFAVVYGAAVQATRELYPNLDDNPGPGKISTAWHQVQYASNSDDMMNPRAIPNGQGMGMTRNAGVSPAASMAGMPTRLATKRYFIRFEVSVIGGRPWRVKVQGHASEWDPGAAMPVELHGVAKPAWLPARTDSLTLAIYSKIKSFAVPMKQELAKTADDELPRTDPSVFAGIPPGAAKRLAEVKDALGHRDYGALRPQLADDIAWSLGGGTGADAAMATWQADPAAFDAMAGTLATCVADGDRRVTCPGGTPVLNSYQLVVEPRGDVWKVTSFVKGE